MLGRFYETIKTYCEESPNMMRQCLGKRLLKPELFRLLRLMLIFSSLNQYSGRHHLTSPYSRVLNTV